MAAPGMLCLSHNAQHQHRLLSLDCSADLRSFSGNLGPGAQEKMLEHIRDACRTQVDRHRDAVLHKEEQQAIRLVRVPELNSNVPAPLLRPMIDVQHPQTPVLRPNHEGTRQQHPQQPAQPAQRDHALPRQPPPQARPQSPVHGDINNHPPAVRQILEQCIREGSLTGRNSAIYHVMCEQLNHYMGDETETVGTFPSLHTANLALVAYLAKEWGDSILQEATWETSGRGSLRCEIDGYFDDTTMSMHIREGKLQ